jgi:MSHA biogenesis protein MshQ
VPDSAGTSDGTCTAVNLMNNAAKQTSVRFGRLRLSSAHGSEVLPLPIPIRAEYFLSPTGFVTNAEDNCTTLAANNIQLKNHVPAGFADSMKSANVQTGASFTKGVGSLKLSKPDPRPTARSQVALCVDLGTDTPGSGAPTCTATSANMPWLQGKWSETKYDDDPSSLATFGVYKSGPVIYMQEIH